MIQKPPGDWQRGATPLASTVENATSLARGGARVARAGAHTMRGLFCWGLALLWGFAALAAGAAGRLPTSVGVGLMAAGMAWAGNRAFAKAHGSQTEARLPPAVSGDAAHEVRYSRVKLSRAVGGGLVLAWLSSLLVHSVGGLTLMLMYVGMICGVIYSILSGIKLCGDGLALRWDDQAITVGTLWKRRTVRRDDLIAIKLSTVTTYVLGVIRTGRATTLKIGTRTAGSLGVMPGLLELNGRTAIDLANELEGWRNGGVPGATAAPTLAFGKAPADRASVAVYPERESVFDADAIMARYLTDKAAVETQAKVAEPNLGKTPPTMIRQRTFGRKSSG